MSGIQGLDDRGATDYFHGRKPILKRFEDLLDKSRETSGGTIFLVQGPPGIGKTALLAECWEKAAEAGWHVAEIDPEDLWDADKLQETLGLPPEKRTVSHTVEGGGTLDLNLVKGGAKRRKTYVVDTYRATPLGLIKKAGGPLLLILDEAQHLGEDGGPPEEHRKPVRTLLKKIHNGGIGKPVILLAGGLGRTHAAFRALGISRMKENSKFDMELLEKEEERLIIRDWLKKAGEATGDVTHWIDTITTETYQWPRHVDSYARNAARLIKDNHGQMTEDLLRSVMEEGRANRMEYYKGRLDGVDNDDILRLVKIFRNAQEHVPQKELLEKLGEAVFSQVVSQGVLYRKNGFYTIPIPSLHKYLTERAAHIREVEARRRRDRMDSDRDTDMGMER